MTKTRSSLVFHALKSIESRYILCGLVNKVTRKFHTPAMRMEDTINAAMVRIASSYRD